MQNPAQVIEGGGSQWLVIAEFIDCGTGNMMILNKGIGGLIGAFERRPEAFIYDHACTLHSIDIIDSMLWFVS